MQQVVDCVEPKGFRERRSGPIPYDRLERGLQRGHGVIFARWLYSCGDMGELAISRVVGVIFTP